jgi:hypothetical protein
VAIHSNRNCRSPSSNEVQLRDTVSAVSIEVLRAGYRTPHPFFEHWVCNYTLQGKRDTEPVVQLHSKKELPLLPSENWIDSVAVDRVQSEPLSGQFPLTGNITEKFWGFHVEAAAGNPLSHWMFDTYGSLVRFRPARNRELLTSYQRTIIP